MGISLNSGISRDRGLTPGNGLVLNEGLTREGDEFVQEFLFTSALPANFTYARNDTVATYRNSLGKWVTSTANNPRFDHDSSGNELGILIEGSRQNKNTNTNVNPTETTNITTSGDAAGVLSVVSDTTELANAKLDAICTNGNVFKADNSGGSTNFIVTLGGTCGNTNAHSISVFARAAVGTVTFQLSSGTGSVNIAVGGYARYLSENITVDNSARQARFVIAAGRSVFFILNQLEEGAFCTSPIVIAGAAATRQRDAVSDTLFATRPYFNQSEMTIAGVVNYSEIANGLTDNHYSFATSSGASSANVYGIFAAATAGNSRMRAAVANTDSAINPRYNHIKGQRTPVGFMFQNNGDVVQFVGGMNYSRFTMGAGMPALDRLVLGAAGNTASPLYGHLEKIIVVNRKLTLSEIAPYVITSGSKSIPFGGQSNAVGYFNSQVAGGNLGAEAMIPLVDAVWTNTDNYLINGATNGSAALEKNDSGSGWWYDDVTGEFGPAYQQWANSVLAFKNAGGVFHAIVWDQGESDSSETPSRLKDAWLVIFNKMRSVVGSVPIIIVPMGRREDNASSDNGYNNLRLIHRELDSEYSFIHLAPEKVIQPLADIVHLSDAGYGAQGPLVIRKALSAAGETIVGPVDGSAISAVSRSGTAVTVTLTHPSGITDFTPTSSIAGFHFYDNTNEITITDAVRTNATTITLTLNSTPSNASQSLYYIYGTAYADRAVYTNFVRGNDTYQIPLKAARWISTNTGSTWTES